MRRREVIAALLAAVAAIATDAAYVALVRSQDATPPSPGVVPFVAAYVGAIAVAALAGAGLILRERTTAARTVLIAAAAGSAALGFLAIFSIGLALLITAGLLSMSALGISARAQPPMPWGTLLLGVLLAVGILVGGFTIAGVFWGP